MPARRCNACNETWPQSHEFEKCPICGGGTVYNSYTASAYTRDEAVAIKENRASMAALPPFDLGIDESPANLNRIEQYVKYGFEFEDATRLAAATRTHRDSKGRAWQTPLNHLDVAAALAAGCTHALAMEVFS